MDEQTLIQINNVMNHNTIIALKEKNKEKEHKYKKNIEKFNSLVIQYEQKNNLKISQLMENIQKLTFDLEKIKTENNKIIQERNIYKNAIESMPKIFRKLLFKNKLLKQ